MNTNELFEIITKLPEYKKYPNSRLIRHRHKKGTLSLETYAKLFDYFGYERVDDWRKKSNYEKE